MRSSILCLSWLSLVGSAFGGIKLPVKGGRLPVFAPRVLQKGPPKGSYPPPPQTTDTQYWTVSPYPTTAGSVPPSSPPVTPETSYPTYIVSAEASSPTKAPTLSAYDEACAAAAKGAVYSTSHAVTFTYFYELLTETFFNVSVVSSRVDTSIQSVLAPALVGCARRRMAQGNITIMGVSQESEDTVTTTPCSLLKASSELDEVCFTLQSALTVYLENSNADASLSTKVFAALSGLLSGSSLVNQQVGIYGLTFVGASLPAQQKAADTTASSTNAVQTGTTASTDSSGLSLTPGAIAVIAAVCLTVLVVGFFVMRRGRQWPAAHKAGIAKMQIDDDDDEKDGDLKLDDERSTPKTVPNASFDKDVGMFVEYEDDESNGYGKVVASRPILKDMDKDAPSPPPPSKKTRGSWFASRSRSPQFGAEGESLELDLPPGSPAKSPRRKYSVDNTVDF